MNQITGKLVVQERLPNTVWGNPVYRIAIANDQQVYWAETRPDAQIGYAIDNYADRQVNATLHGAGGKYLILQCEIAE